MLQLLWLALCTLMLLTAMEGEEVCADLAVQHFGKRCTPSRWRPGCRFRVVEGREVRADLPMKRFVEWCAHYTAERRRVRRRAPSSHIT